MSENTMQSAARRVRAVRAAGSCTVLARDQALEIPAAAFTLAGFRLWATSDEVAELARFSYLAGEIIINMSPEEINSHNLVKVEVGRVVASINARHDLGMFLGDRILFTNVKAELSTEPDSAFVFYESLESGKARMVEREDGSGRYLEIEGSLDWLTEIVSKHSVRKDTQVLRELYHRARVDEFWLINAMGKKIDMRILRWEPAGYVPAATKGGWQYSGVFKAWFRLVREKNRVGLWNYTLEMKTK